MVARGIVPFAPRGDDSHPPIRTVILSCQLGDHLARVAAVQQPEPHRHARKHAWLLDRLAGGVDPKRVCGPRLDPENPLQRLPFGRELARERLRLRSLVQRLRQPRERAQRFHVTGRLVQFQAHGQQRPAFHPARPHTQVLREPGAIQRGAHEVQRFPQPCLLFARESHVSAGFHVVANRRDEQWRRICGVITVRKIAEPRRQ